MSNVIEFPGPKCSPLAAYWKAMAEVDEAMRRMLTAFHQLNAVMAEIREHARVDDPGLEHAVQAARFADPDIGWLDVAAAREANRRY